MNYSCFKTKILFSQQKGGKSLLESWSVSNVAFLLFSWVSYFGLLVCSPQNNTTDETILFESKFKIGSCLIYLLSFVITNRYFFLVSLPIVSEIEILTRNLPDGNLIDSAFNVSPSMKAIRRLVNDFLIIPFSAQTFKDLISTGASFFSKTTKRDKRNAAEWYCWTNSGWERTETVEHHPEKCSGQLQPPVHNKCWLWNYSRQ